MLQLMHIFLVYELVIGLLMACTYPSHVPMERFTFLVEGCYGSNSLPEVCY